MFQISHAMVVGDNTKQRLRTNTATPTRAKGIYEVAIEMVTGDIVRKKIVLQ